MTSHQMRPNSPTHLAVYCRPGERGMQDSYDFHLGRKEDFRQKRYGGTLIRLEEIPENLKDGLTAHWIEKTQHRKERTPALLTRLLLEVKGNKAHLLPYYKILPATGISQLTEHYLEEVALTHLQSRGISRIQVNRLPKRRAARLAQIEVGVDRELPIKEWLEKIPRQAHG